MKTPPPSPNPLLTLPTFAQLTAPVVPTANDDTPHAARCAARRFVQRMERMERDMARARAEHTAGKLSFPFDLRVLETPETLQIADAHSIDYFGLCLLLAKRFSRNPFTRAQIMESPSRRKLWFDKTYRTDADLRDDALATLYALIEAKRAAGLVAEPIPNTVPETRNQSINTINKTTAQDTALFRELDAALQSVYADVPGFDVRDLSPPR